MCRREQIFRCGRRKPGENSSFAVKRNTYNAPLNEKEVAAVFSEIGTGCTILRARLIRRLKSPACRFGLRVDMKASLP